jgi:hypothetical protein
MHVSASGDESHAPSSGVCWRSPTACRDGICGAWLMSRLPYLLLILSLLMVSACTGRDLRGYTGRDERLPGRPEYDRVFVKDIHFYVAADNLRGRYGTRLTLQRELSVAHDELVDPTRGSTKIVDGVLVEEVVFPHLTGGIAESVATDGDVWVSFEEGASLRFRPLSHIDFSTLAARPVNTPTREALAVSDAPLDPMGTGIVPGGVQDGRWLGTSLVYALVPDGVLYRPATKVRVADWNWAVRYGDADYEISTATPDDDYRGRFWPILVYDPWNYEYEEWLRKQTRTVTGREPAQR